MMLHRWMIVFACLAMAGRGFGAESPFALKGEVAGALELTINPTGFKSAGVDGLSIPLPGGKSVEFPDLEYALAPSPEVLIETGDEVLTMRSSPLDRWMGRNDAGDWITISQRGSTAYGTVVLSKGGTYVLGPAPGKDGADHRLEPLRELPWQALCSTPSPEAPVPIPTAILKSGGMKAEPITGIDYTVTVALDVTSDVTTRLGGTAPTLEYVEALVQQVTAIYERDARVAVRLTTVRFRDVASDPYKGIADGIVAYGMFYQELSQPGIPSGFVSADMNHLIFGTGGGLSIGQTLCRTNPQDRLSLSGIGGTNPYPALGIGSDAAVLAHELGHSMSAHHTHCYDPPIHRCNTTECYVGPLVMEEGDLMSYCSTNLLRLHPIIGQIVHDWVGSRSCVTAPTLDHYEPDSSTGTAGVLDSVLTMSHLLSAPTDLDYSRFEVPAGLASHLTVEFETPVAATVAITNTFGATVGSATLGPGALSHTFSFPCGADTQISGFHYVRVAPVGTLTSTARYTLRLVTTACDGVVQDSFEPDNNWKEARPLTSGAMEYHVCTGVDEDWFLIHATGDKAVRISIEATAGFYGARVYTTDFRALHRVLLSPSEDIQFGCDELLLEEGDYYLRIYKAGAQPLVSYRVALVEEECDCLATVSPDEAEVGPGGEPLIFSVDPSGCGAPSFTAEPWLEIVDEVSTEDSIVVDVMPNNGGARSGEIRIAGRRVKISQAGGDPLEPNDTGATATLVPYSTTVTHSLWPTSDVDLFAVDVPDNSVLNVTSTSKRGTPSIKVLSSENRGNALSLDGINDDVVLPNRNWFPTGKLTIEGWVKPREHRSFNRMVHFGDPTNNVVSIMPSYGTTGRPYFVCYKSLQLKAYAIAPEALPLNQWSHLAATFDGSVWIFYVNGGEIGRTVTTEAPAQIVTTRNRLGHDGSAEPRSNMVMDDFRIWDRARSAEEIARGRSGLLPNDRTGLVAEYTFESLENLLVNGDGTDDVRDQTGSFHADTNGSPRIIASDLSPGLASSRGLTYGCGFVCSETTAWLSTACMTGGRFLVEVTATAGEERWRGEVRTTFSTTSCGGCFPALTPESAVLPWNGSETTVAVALSPGCSMTIEPEVAWLTASLVDANGAPIVRIKTQDNSTGSARVGTVRIAGGVFTVHQNPGSCAGVVTAHPDGMEIGPEGGTGQARLTYSRATCRTGLTLVSSAAWLEVGSEDSYRDVLRWTAAPNLTGQARTALIRHDGTSILGVTQSAIPCVNPTEPYIINVAADGGPVDLASGLAASCFWDAESYVPWIKAPAFGSGNGTTPWRLEVERNFSSSPRVANTTPFGRAMENRGTTGAIRIPSGTWFDGPFTVEARVLAHGVTAWSRILEFGNGPGQDNITLLLSEWEYPRFAAFALNGTNTVHSLRSSERMPNGRWVHVAMTWDGATVRLYQDGSLVGSQAATQGPRSVLRSQNVILNTTYWDPPPNAQVDEVRVWSVARTAAQLQAGMAGPITANQTGLRLYYQFDEQPGSPPVNLVDGTSATVTTGITSVPARTGLVTLGGTDVIVMQEGAEPTVGWMLTGE